MSGKMCYCKLGVMAQCVAKDVDEQMACFFSAQSSNGKRCMHLNENMNNHCWNPKAHEFSSMRGVVRFEDITEPEPETIYDESKELGMETGPRRTCMNCINYNSCAKLIDLAVACAPLGGITEQDLWTKGSSCDGYIGETKITIAGGI